MEPPTHKLYLGSPEVREAILRLDGVHLAQRTLANWLEKGFVVASIKWPRRRGPANAVQFNLSDLARIRLLVALRKRHNLPFDIAIDIIRQVDADLLRAPGAATIAVAIDGWRVRIAGRDGAQDVALPGQLRLPLQRVVDGNEQVARELIAQRTA
jgi:hypothetical protein